MFHPIVIKQETQAQCAGNEAQDKGLFSSPPFPSLRSVWLSLQHMIYDNRPVFSHLPGGAEGGILGEAAPPPQDRWTLAGRSLRSANNGLGSLRDVLLNPSSATTYRRCKLLNLEHIASPRVDFLVC